MVVAIGAVLYCPFHHYLPFLLLLLHNPAEFFFFFFKEMSQPAFTAD